MSSVRKYRFKSGFSGSGMHEDGRLVHAASEKLSTASSISDWSASAILATPGLIAGGTIPRNKAFAVRFSNSLALREGERAAKLPPNLHGSEKWRPPLGGFPKRALDLLLASVALLLLAPIMLIVTALIRVVMGGPIFFVQERIGFDGNVFFCYKFRTMVAIAEEVPNQPLATDPQAARQWRERIDCLGSLLRKSSLDELPQLFNVLRGDMSLVGPCPIVPDEFKCYGRHAQACFKARPGLTGMSQTRGRNRLTYSARAARDCYYVRHWSMWLDLVLLIKTIPEVLNFDETA